VDWFTDRHFFLLAVVVYGFSMFYSVFLWRHGFRKDDRINYLLLLFAFALHTTAMVKRGFSFNRCPVNNLYEAITFLSWTIVTAYLVVGMFRRLCLTDSFCHWRFRPHAATRSTARRQTGFSHGLGQYSRIADSPFLRCFWTQCHSGRHVFDSGT
jgi:hypothetical protein